MAPRSKSYQAVQQDPDERWRDDESSQVPCSVQQRPPRHPLLSWIVAATALVFLAVSITVNIFLAWQIKHVTPPPQETDSVSYYGPYCHTLAAGLKRTLPLQIYPDTDYTGDNLSAVTDLWEKLSGDPGVVALPSDYVSEKRLPHAYRFPWDQDKGVYLLQGFHNLHCLRTLFRYIKYTEQGVPNHIALSHALHCLDQLRQDVLCNADDTPRYAGFQTPAGTGAGQVRMCRDWRALETWALEHTACFKHEDEVPGPMVDRFKSCPDGRVLWPTAAAVADRGR
ncbi:uncharacterized protein B0H64DRAFT_317844 [Chaetomium fimeti]|uniref:Uncharacterized protein n=1 Tax=Chaetomium fimeti TaxID=1854472 RepID=A0AAE0HMY4_9PEZI|nr:hypothetical protein B0H64DRAFT_317844 [Chaetomium fimeti]